MPEPKYSAEELEALLVHLGHMHHEDREQTIKRLAATLEAARPAAKTEKPKPK